MPAAWTPALQFLSWHCQKKPPFPTWVAGLCTATPGFWNLRKVTIIKVSVRSELSSVGSKGSSNLSPSPGTGQDSGVALEMNEKKEHLQALPTAAARSSQRSAAALFAQVTVTQHSLCLAMPRELPQTQPSPAQPRPAQPRPGQPACSAFGFSQASPASVLLLDPTPPLSLPQELLNAIQESTPVYLCP